jgi:hypothetical protein
MAHQLFIASWLMALCVTIHAGGIAWALRIRQKAEATSRFWKGTFLMIVIAIWMVLLHLAEISAWAATYVWNHALPDLHTALYFSAVTYTTVGYGDVVLPKEWRLDGGIEALTGILMCGWSTGFFFTVVNHLYEQRGSGASSEKSGSSAKLIP